MKTYQQRKEEAREMAIEWPAIIPSELDAERLITTQRFLLVRDALNTSATRLEYIRCYRMPLGFYRLHTVDEAITFIKHKIHAEYITGRI